jgi:hypothetical protein
MVCSQGLCPSLRARQYQGIDGLFDGVFTASLIIVGTESRHGIGIWNAEGVFEAMNGTKNGVCEAMNGTKKGTMMSRAIGDVPA